MYIYLNPIPPVQLERLKGPVSIIPDQKEEILHDLSNMSSERNFLVSEASL